MNFQDLAKIENPDFYLDVAFRRASKKISELRQQKKDTKKTKLEQQKSLEQTRMDIISTRLMDSLMGILKKFPSISQLPPFYQELINCTLDFPVLKKSLGALNWAQKKVHDITKIYRSKIQKADHLDRVFKLQKEYYGRISSVLKQIKNELHYLDEARKVMRKYPAVKTSDKIRSVSILGFPNVGKTTLLYKLTGSKPEINSYPFTTKGINISYIKGEKHKIQILDTPGTLNRFNKMNDIEKQAYLTIKYVADYIVYVFDLTEEYYSLKDQIKLYTTLKEHDKPITVYISKADILDKKVIDEFKKKYKTAITDYKDLKKTLSGY